MSLVAAKTGRKLQIDGFRFFTFFSALHLCLWICLPIEAQNPRKDSLTQLAVDSRLSVKLLSDYRFSVTEKPLRDTLHSLAAAAQINVWLDRRLDPTTLITTGAEGRTLYQAISACALTVGASVGVVDNVVLVGRKEWVERVAGVVLARPRSNASKNVIAELHWADLTTPTQAAACCVASSAQRLPHDLWPAVQWTKIDGPLALLLVTAQFDLMPAPDPVDAYTPIVVPAVVSALYPTGTQATAMRAAIAEVDPKAKIKEVNSQLVVAGTAAAHLAAINAWLMPAVGAKPKILDVDKIQFSIDLKNAVAEQVFAQLSGTAGRTLVIAPEAMESCKQKVSLSAKDTTLRTLSERVATAAKVSVTWTDTQLNVTAAK